MLIAVCMFLVIIFGSLVQAASLPIGLVVTELLLILLPAILYVRFKRLPIAQSLRWKRVKPAMLVRGVILGVLGWGMAAIVYLIASTLVQTVLGPDPVPELLTRALPKTLPEFAAFLIVLAVLPGLCEETLFRGAIQGTFEKKGIWKGVIYTALLFGAFHVNPWSFVSAAGLGLLFGTITVRTNSTLPAIIAHTCNNATACTVAFVFRDGPEYIPYAIMGVFALLFVGALVEFLCATRRGDRQPSPLTAAPANLSRGGKWGLAGAGAGMVILMVLAIFAAIGITGRYRMTSDHLAPEINRGDIVVVLKSRYVKQDIQPGDVVAVRQHGQVLLRKVARIEDEHIWVVHGPSGTSAAETQVLRRDVIGKMIWKIADPKPLGRKRRPSIDV